MFNVCEGISGNDCESPIPSDGIQDGSISTGATGVLSNAWDFTGGRVDLSHQFIPTSGDYTYSTWVNFDSFSANMEVLRADGGSFEVWYSNGGGGLYYSLTTGSQIIETDANLSSGTWYNIVLVHSSSGDKAYLNGVEKSTTGIRTVPTETTWYLGGRSNNSENLNGKMDQTVVWSTALSPSDVTSLYNSGSGTTTLPQSSSVIKPVSYTHLPLPPLYSV